MTHLDARAEMGRAIVEGHLGSAIDRDTPISPPAALITRRRSEEE